MLCKKKKSISINVRLYFNDKKMYDKKFKFKASA